jgi:hypothetical protein
MLFLRRYKMRSTIALQCLMSLLLCLHLLAPPPLLASPNLPLGVVEDLHPLLLPALKAYWI